MPLVRRAGAPDLTAITSVVAACGLKTDDILAPGTAWFVAEGDGAITGTVGIEGFGCAAVLLRSLSVLPLHRNTGIGAELTRFAEDASRAAGAKYLYLFSTGAGAYYRRTGYVEAPVVELTDALPDVPQVRQYERLGWLPTEIAWRKPLTSSRIRK